MAVESHIVVADEVVAFFADRFGSVAVAPFLPSEHRLTDVDAAVVDDVGLNHLVAVGFEDARQAESEQIVADMTQVEWLVGVGRRIFYHHQRALGSFFLETILFHQVEVSEHRQPELRFYRYVKEAFDNVVGFDSLAVFNEVIADFGSGSFRRLL